MWALFFIVLHIVQIFMFASFIATFFDLFEKTYSDLEMVIIEMIIVVCYVANAVLILPLFLMQLAIVRYKNKNKF